MASRYILGGYWPSRKESVEACADRLSKFLIELADCEPVLATWYERGRSRKEALERRADLHDKGYLLDLLGRGRNRRDVGRAVIEELGFSVGLWNGGGEEEEASLTIKCGLYRQNPGPNSSLSNNVILTLPRNLGNLGRAETMARVVTAVARNWEPAWAGVMSRDAMNARNFDADRPFVDWITYVPFKIEKIDPPSWVQQIEGLGSVAITQPTPPSTDNPEELARIGKIEGLLRAA